MTLLVQFTRSGEPDVRTIRDWIAIRSRQGAIAWLDAFDDVSQMLAAEARECSSASEAEILGIDLRQKLFRTRRGRMYRLLFVIQDQTAHIVASSRNWTRFCSVGRFRTSPLIRCDGASMSSATYQATNLGYLWRKVTLLVHRQTELRDQMRRAFEVIQ